MPTLPLSTLTVMPSLPSLLPVLRRSVPLPGMAISGPRPVPPPIITSIIVIFVMAVVFFPRKLAHPFAKRPFNDPDEPLATVRLAIQPPGKIVIELFQQAKLDALLQMNVVPPPTRGPKLPLLHIPQATYLLQHPLNLIKKALRPHHLLPTLPQFLAQSPKTTHKYALHPPPVPGGFIFVEPPLVPPHGPDEPSLVNKGEQHLTEPGELLAHQVNFKTHRKVVGKGGVGLEHKFLQTLGQGMTGLGRQDCHELLEGLEWPTQLKLGLFVDLDV